MASIREIAAEVGYSVSTVSRVINNRVDVDPETRRKILEAVERHDYSPSLIAQGLRKRHGKLLGLAVPENSQGAFNLMIQVALDAAYRRGYNLILVNTHEDPALEESYIRDLLRRDVNGIIFSRVSDESRILKTIIKRKIAFIVVDRALEHEYVTNIVLNNRKAGAMAADHLLRLGHRQIACVSGPLKIALCRERLKGFCDALEEAGIKVLPERLFQGDFNFESGIESVKRLWAEPNNVTAIWAMNDSMAFGVLSELHRRGVRIPHTVSVMGMDDLDTAKMVNPPLTTIHYPIRELIETAVEMITAHIDGGNDMSGNVVLEPSLTLRESTTACRAVEPLPEQISEALADTRSAESDAYR